jgi:hypothetical protein
MLQCWFCAGFDPQQHVRVSYNANDQNEQNWQQTSMLCATGSSMRMLQSIVGGQPQR